MSSTTTFLVVTLLILCFAGAVGLYMLRPVVTETAVAVAVSTVYRHWLHVLYRNGKSEEWYFERDENLGPITLWKPFVRWWYSQQNKPYFAVQVPDKHIMLSRENIVRFALRVEKTDAAKLKT